VLRFTAARNSCTRGRLVQQLGVGCVQQLWRGSLRATAKDALNEHYWLGPGPAFFYILFVVQVYPWR
jgi:hypothetical protein